MKADLIADWRARVADRTLITLPVTAIERVLEERERLLMALRAVVECGSADSYQDEAYNAALAAVAYAEAET